MNNGLDRRIVGRSPERAGGAADNQLKRDAASMRKGDKHYELCLKG
jgi:hypothetical protein